MDKIDTKLIKILKSESTNKDLISNIKYLINANVLNHIETQLCEKVLEQIELIGIPDLEGALKQLNINDDLNNILGYEKLKILEKIIFYHTQFFLLLINYDNLLSPEIS